MNKQRRNNGKDWVCSQDQAGGRLLLHTSTGRHGLLLSCSGFQESGNDEGGTVRPVHSDSDSRRNEESRRNQCGSDRSVTYPAIVYLSAIGIAIVVAGISYFLPILAGKVSHLSGLWWDIGGAVVLLVFCIVIFSLLRIAGISDEHIAENGGGK